MNNEITLLQEQIKEYKDLFYNSLTPTIITDVDGNYLEYNRSYLELFGYEEGIDLSVYPAQSGSPKFQKNNKLSIEESKKKIAYTLKNGSNEFEWLHKKINGETFESLVNLTKIQFQGKVAIKVKIKDISEKRKLERLIEEKQKTLMNKKIFFQELSMNIHIQLF